MPPNTRSRAKKKREEVQGERARCFHQPLSEEERVSGWVVLPGRSSPDKDFDDTAFHVCRTHYRLLVNDEPALLITRGAECGLDLHMHRDYGAKLVPVGLKTWRRGSDPDDSGDSEDDEVEVGHHGDQANSSSRGWCMTQFANAAVLIVFLVGCVTLFSAGTQRFV